MTVYKQQVGQRIETCASYLYAIIPFTGSKLLIGVAVDGIVGINNTLELNYLPRWTHEANITKEK